MDRFWKAALAVGGLGAIGAFVFWSLYQQWLSLPIFSRLSPEQTFEIMKMFLVLTFFALLVFAGLYIASKGGGSNDGRHTFELHQAWSGINEVDCERLVGPDVTNAVRAMTITASSWINNLVDKKIIIENHFDDFKLLYDALWTCNRVVPGFEKRGTRCRDFVTQQMHQAFREMQAYKNGGAK